MNESGLFVKGIEKAFEPKGNQIKIICDDLETDIGKVKFSIIGGDR
jgi:peptidyl-tRNA hydrolase